jgi:hypothetical protein
MEWRIAGGLLMISVAMAASCGQAPREGRLAQAQDTQPACPIEVRYALADSQEDPGEVRLVLEDNTPVVSALGGMVANVASDEESGWAEATVRSTDLALTYRFYLDSARSSLPVEGVDVRPGDVIGGAHELLDLKAEATDGLDTPELSGMLDTWGCREGLTPTRALQARLLDGSLWEIQLAEPIEVAGTEGVTGYGELLVDGEVVADATRFGQRPDFTRPFSPRFDPPSLLDKFTLADGRRAEHWNWAPSHENDTFAYALWVEGPGEHMYFSSSQPIQEAELVARSLRMSEADGRIEAVWFVSERVDVAKLQAVFFLMDPEAPLQGPEVRLNAPCRVGQDSGADCTEAELEGPVYTPGTQRALQGATIRRLGPEASSVN